MLKHTNHNHVFTADDQPPSGGCVLKLKNDNETRFYRDPAAFGRLCVETLVEMLQDGGKNPAAFGRLCVETEQDKKLLETRKASRLRAAVC